MSSIDLKSDNGGSNTLHLIEKKTCFGKLFAGLLLVLGPLAACENGPAELVPAAFPDRPEPAASTCGGKGALQAMLSGAIVARLDWPDDALDCESMPRPDAEGVRLRFSGEVGEERLTIIIALPGLNPGQTGDEFDSNVTISVEGSGRFFSAPNLDTCWTAVTINEPFAEDSDTYTVVGGLTCVTPLGEINGDGFVDIQLLKFSGIANWSRT